MNIVLFSPSTDLFIRCLNFGISNSNNCLQIKQNIKKTYDMEILRQKIKKAFSCLEILIQSAIRGQINFFSYLSTESKRVTIKKVGYLISVHK